MEKRSGIGSDRGSGRLSQTSDDVFSRQKQELHSKLVAAMDLSTLGSMSEEDLRREVRRVAEEMTRQSAELMGIRERDRLVTEVLDETFGLGPLEPLLHDPTITDILVNGPKVTYVERGGRLERTDVSFIDERHLRQIVQRIAGRVGRRVDELTPMVDARLADGSRVNAVIPPIALDGTLLSIRRFGVKPLLAVGPGRQEGDHAGDDRFPVGVREGSSQHGDLRGHGQRQDDAAQCVFGVHPP